MFFIIGFVMVCACVLGGYMALGGKLSVLWQPFEYVIIFGGGLGAMIIGNPKNVLGAVVKNLSVLLKGTKYNKKHYLELLGCMYAVFRLAKAKGELALEAHV